MWAGWLRPQFHGAKQADLTPPARSQRTGVKASLAHQTASPLKIAPTTLMVLQQTTNGGHAVGVHKQSVSFTDAAFSFARELVESGEYPNISAATLR